MPENSSIDEKTQIPTNLRLLLIVEEVAKAGAPVTLTALSAATGLPKPTIHRLVATAEQEGFLQRDVDGRSFGPGARMRRISGNILSSQRIRTERLIVMKALAEAVGETCNLASPLRHGMVYLDRVETHWPLRIQLPIGTQVPFHCTASGKMYLSSLRPDRLSRILSWLQLEKKTERTITNEAALREELSLIRQRGYSTDDQEFMQDMVAVATPIKDSEGRLLASLAIHAPLQRHSLASIEQELPQVQKAARRIEEVCLED